MGSLSLKFSLSCWSNMKGRRQALILDLQYFLKHSAMWRTYNSVTNETCPEGIRENNMLFGKGRGGEPNQHSGFLLERIPAEGVLRRERQLSLLSTAWSYWEHMVCKPPHTLLYNIVSCACFLFLLVFSVYECSYASVFFF